MKNRRNCANIICFILFVVIALISATTEVKAYTNEDVTDPILRRMGKQLNWSDSYIKKAGGHITYQITGINDGRTVYTSFDGYAYGVTGNNNRIPYKLSSMLCKQHQNRIGGGGEVLNQCYVIAFSNAPTCTSGGWVWLGCSDDVYSYWYYHNFKEQLVPDEAHRIDLSSHYGYYQDALGHDYNYDVWIYTDNNGIKNGMRYHRCNYCNAYTDLQYLCRVTAGTGIASVTGEGWYSAGSAVTLTAEPKTGYTWNKWMWTGNGSSTNQTYTFVINNAYEFTALAIANEYRIRFDANGGVGYMPDIAFIYDVPQILPTNAFTRNNGYGDSLFLGWNTMPDAREAMYYDGTEIINATPMNGVVVTLYAIWDDCPWIEAENMYYSLKAAQSGKITQEEILSHAKAFDRECGDTIESGMDTQKGTSFTIIDYIPEKFTALVSEGSVPLTFQVIDSAGNSYKKMITVYIVDTEPVIFKPIGTTRFISEKYYYESYEKGGLQEDSIWKKDAEYMRVIEQAFENARNNTPMKTYHFTYEDILKMK